MENHNDQPKWIDEEDEHIQINLNEKNNLKKLKKTLVENVISGDVFQNRLREQFCKMTDKNDLYKWALSTDDEDVYLNDTPTDDLDYLLKTNRNITSADMIREKDSKILKINQVPDLNKESPHNSIVSCMSFHPTKENLCFTAGYDKKMKLFSISDNDNFKSKTVQVVNTIDIPITSAKYLNTREIIITGKRKHYVIYDIETNKLERCNGHYSQKELSSLEKVFVGEGYYAFGGVEGYITIYDSASKRFRYDIKIPGTVNSICFNKEGTHLYAVGDQSEIYVFDLRKYRTCLNKVNDVGNFNTNYMDISKDSSYIATGT